MIRKIGFVLIGILSTLILGLILLEIVFGGWLKSNSGWHVADKIGITRNQKITFDNTLSYGKQFFNHQDRFGTSTWNQYGLRGTCEPSETQIVVMGGSTTHNLTTSDEKVWTSVLQIRLREKLKQQNICVMNAGVNGQTSYGHIASLEKWLPLIPKFSPKIYIFYMGINDAGFEAESVISWESGKFDISSFENFTKWLKWNSATYRGFKLIQYTWKRYAPAEQRAYTNVNLETKVTELNYSDASRLPDTERLIEKNKLIFEKNLKRIIKNVKQNDAMFICISQPHQLTRIINGEKRGIGDAGRYSGVNINGLDYDASLRALNSIMEQKCSGKNGHYINLTDKEFSINSYWDYVHMTPDGQNLLANLITNELLSIKNFSPILIK